MPENGYEESSSCDSSKVSASTYAKMIESFSLSEVPSEREDGTPVGSSTMKSRRSKAKRTKGRSLVQFKNEGDARDPFISASLGSIEK